MTRLIITTFLAVLWFGNGKNNNISQKKILLNTNNAMVLSTSITDFLPGKYQDYYAYILARKNCKDHTPSEEPIYDQLVINS